MYLNLDPKQMVRLNLALAVLFICVGVYSLQSDSLPISSFTGFIFAIAFNIPKFFETRIQWYYPSEETKNETKG